MILICHKYNTRGLGDSGSVLTEGHNQEARQHLHHLLSRLYCHSGSLVRTSYGLAGTWSFSSLLQSLSFLSAVLCILYNSCFLLFRLFPSLKEILYYILRLSVRNQNEAKDINVSVVFITRDGCKETGLSSTTVGRVPQFP